MPSFYSRNARHLSLVALISAITAGMIVVTSNASADKSVNVQLPPPPTVSVEVLQQQNIRTWESFSGRLAPVESVELRPLVAGTVQQVLFHDGEYVKAKQPLFVIDPRPHQATFNRANAQLQSARAQAKLLTDEFKRAQKLNAENLISQSQFETTVSQKESAIATLAEAEALLEQAKLNLEYANITAPVGGRISRAEVTQGNVVEAGAGAPVLARIVADDEFYVEFNVDEQTYIKLSRSKTESTSMPIELTLDGDDVVYHGEFHAFDNQLDPASGTIRARAIVKNTDKLLTAGMYTHVRLGSPEKASVLLVPESAIGTNQNKKFVLVVDEEQTARYREITLGAQWQGHRIVRTGLSEGERVIVNGLSHVQPDSPVALAANSTLASVN